MDSKQIEYKAGFETSAKLGSQEEYRFRIDFYLFLEDDIYIAYCPALDLSSSGETHTEAVSNFYEAFQLYVETCIEAGTFIQDLKQLGWEIKNATITPPKFKFLMKKPEFSSLIESHTDYERIVSHPLPVHIPCAH
jgi:hypothetical protein